jgi:hypothetical protein
MKTLSRANGATLPNPNLRSSGIDLMCGVKGKTFGVYFNGL